LLAFEGLPRQPEIASPMVEGWQIAFVVEVGAMLLDVIVSVPVLVARRFLFNGRQIGLESPRDIRAESRHALSRDGVRASLRASQLTAYHRVTPTKRSLGSSRSGRSRTNRPSGVLWRFSFTS